MPNFLGDETNTPLISDMQDHKAVKNAIEQLEESRKSFKSERLATLRKNLTGVLMDSA